MESIDTAGFTVENDETTWQRQGQLDIRDIGNRGNNRALAPVEVTPTNQDISNALSHTDATR
jgi:trimethylamine:corrinoid methyltransferase-like protein